MSDQVDLVLDELEKTWLKAYHLGETLAAVCNAVGIDKCIEKVEERLSKWRLEPSIAARIIVMNYEMLLKKMIDTKMDTHGRG